MARPNSRSTLLSHCLGRLGEPVIQVNVAPEQLEDRLDDALDKFSQYHYDATHRAYISYQLTAADITNKYIPVSDSIAYVTKVFAFNTSFGSSSSFFDIKYQMMLNDITSIHTWFGDLAYYDQLQQYLTTMDMLINGQPQIEFSRKQNRVYLFGNIEDQDIVEGDWVVMEVLQIVDPDTFTEVWNDDWLKDYTTALIKRQWGQNLIKFEGMQLPGGVLLNGRQIYDDAIADIERLEEKLRLDKELPPEFMIG